MNRFESVAKTLTHKHGVHVEYISANREYVVEGIRAESARKADKVARELAHAAIVYHGHRS